MLWITKALDGANGPRVPGLSLSMARRNSYNVAAALKLRSTLTRGSTKHWKRRKSYWVYLEVFVNRSQEGRSVEQLGGSSPRRPGATPLALHYGRAIGRAHIDERDAPPRKASQTLCHSLWVVYCSG